ncbi:hypothetical protein PMIN06_007055 [Paraphaeosphaeria minitans]
MFLLMSNDGCTYLVALNWSLTLKRVCQPTYGEPYQEALENLQTSSHSDLSTMMYARNVVLGIVAAALPFAAADIPTTLWCSVETASAPVSTAGLACIDSCDCMSKLCTDDAVIKGTTTHLTYLCPETKTVEVTETIFVTVHDGESRLPVLSASTNREQTTTVMATSKSTLFITKTVISKHPTSSSLGETPFSASNPLVSSSTAVGTGEPEYPEPSAPTQNHPEPTTTVHVTSESTSTVLKTMSSHSVLPFWPVRPTHSILTNPLRPSPTASGIWLNTTTLAAVSQSSSGTESNSTVHLTMVPHTTSTAVSMSTDRIAISSGTESLSTLYLTMPSLTTSAAASLSTSGVTASSAINFTLTVEETSVTESKSTLYLTMLSHTNSTAASMSTDGVAESFTINSTLTLVMSSATGPIPTPPAPGYTPSSVMKPIITPVVPEITPGFPSASLTITATDDRPAPGLPQLTVSVSDNFISLPSDSETSWSIPGEESTITDLENYPTIKPDSPTPAPSIMTDGIFFSLDAPPYPTAVPEKRRNGEQQSHVDGTIGMVHMTTTVAVQGKNSTIIGTGSSGKVSGSYPGATSEPLGPNGAGNTQPWPAWVVVIVLAFAELF